MGNQEKSLLIAATDFPTVRGMSTSTRRGTPRHAGREWLADAHPTPDDALRSWSAGGLASIPTGRLWLAAEAPLLRTVVAMQRVPPKRLGPVLAYPEAECAWWLIPPDDAHQLDDVARFTVHPPGWPLYCPPLNRPAGGRVWLERPDGSGRLTDPIVLGAAFGPAGRLPAEAHG